MLNKRIDSMYEHHENVDSSASIILSQLASDKAVNWHEAIKKYAHLKHYVDESSQKLWFVIHSMAYISDLVDVIDWRTELYSCRDEERKFQLRTFLHAVLHPKGDISTYSPSWVTIYQTVYKEVEFLIEEAHTERFQYLDKIFSIAESAQFVLNDLSLSMTIPIEEARTNPYVDSYTGVPDPMDENIVMPHITTLPNKDGDMVTIDWHDQSYTTVDALGNEVVRNMKPDFEPEAHGTFIDYDHEWTDERGMTSVPITQMNEQEYHITDEAYRLLKRFDPLIFEINKVFDKHIHLLTTSKTYFITHHLSGQTLEETATCFTLRDPLVIQFQEYIKEIYHDYEPQDIAVLLMQLPFELKVNGNLSTIIDQFGDEILDSIVDGSGFRNVDEHSYEHEIELFHQKNLAELKKIADLKSPIHTSEFLVSAFEGINNGLSVANAMNGAYEAFRSISPSGSLAFKNALISGKSRQKAMAQFYITAHRTGEYTPRDKFLSATNSSILLLTAASGYQRTRKITWDTLKYKIKQGEVFVSSSAPSTSKSWLKNKLDELHFPSKLLPLLSEG